MKSQQMNLVVVELVMFASSSFAFADSQASAASVSSCPGCAASAVLDDGVQLLQQQLKVNGLDAVRPKENPLPPKGTKCEDEGYWCNPGKCGHQGDLFADNANRQTSAKNIEGPLTYPTKEEVEQMKLPTYPGISAGDEVCLETYQVIDKTGDTKPEIGCARFAKGTSTSYLKKGVPSWRKTDESVCNSCFCEQKGAARAAKAAQQAEERNALVAQEKERAEEARNHVDRSSVRPDME